ncbi:MAG TPA: EAL domain-containing protein [Tepidisphaeraceae bacterium]|nr:EAL domain-containing protein [Tepidisphaeraceae bacterium]
MGVRIYMDDFGTGYSSLSCLHQLPLTGIKIDKSFVQSLGERRDYAAVICAIVTLARNLGMSLVAEGIETADQAAMLQTMECNKAQGYFFSPPMDATAATAYIEKYHLNVGPFSLAS